MNFKHFFQVLLFFQLCVLNVNSFSAEPKNEGEKLYSEHCADCHGEKGRSTTNNIPIISGFSAINIFDSLSEFKDGDREALDIERKDGTSLNMKEVSKRLTEEQTESIAFYLSKQQFIPAIQNYDDLLAKEGKQIHEDLCNDCHGDYGKSVLDDAPILAGQWKDYLIRQFKQISEKKRYIPRKMKRKFRKLSEQDKIALLNFYTNSQTQR